MAISQVIKKIIACEIAVKSRCRDIKKKKIIKIKSIHSYNITKERFIYG